MTNTTQQPTHHGAASASREFKTSRVDPDAESESFVLEKFVTINFGNHPLSPPQKQIIPLIIAGKTDKQIATELGKGTTVGAIRGHAREIFDRLGVSSRLELAVLLVAPRTNGDMNSSLKEFLDGLSQKERDIATLLAKKGMDDRAIAAQMNYTYSQPIKNYVRRIGGKAMRYTGTKPPNRVALAAIIICALGYETAHNEQSRAETARGERGASYAQEINTLGEWRRVAGQVVRDVCMARNIDIATVAAGILKARVKRTHKNEGDLLTNARPDSLLRVRTWKRIEEVDTTLGLDVPQNGLRHLEQLFPDEPLVRDVIPKLLACLAA